MSKGSRDLKIRYLTDYGRAGDWFGLRPKTICRNRPKIKRVLSIVLYATIYHHSVRGLIKQVHIGSLSYCDEIKDHAASHQ